MKASAYGKLCLTLLSVVTCFSRIDAAYEDEMSPINPRIVNGKPVKDLPSFFVRPFQASRNLQAICGATLIHSDFVITAAHCWGAFRNGVVVYDGDDYTRQIAIDRRIRHPQWDFYEDGQLNYDFMLLRLEESIAVDDTAQPIAFNMNPDIPSVNDTDFLTIYGYGKIETGALAEELRQTSMLYIDNEECTEYFVDNGIPMNTTLPDEFLCTVSPDAEVDVSTCRGDSGGPVTATINETEVLVGVVSAGIDCSTEVFPNGNARISAAANWIQEQICKHSRNSSSMVCNSEDRDSPSLSAVEVKLAFTFDDHPEQTLHAIRSTQDRSLIYSGPQAIAEFNEQLNTTIYLEPGEYSFEVYDVKSDGMKSVQEDSDSTTLHGWQLYEVSWTAPIDQTNDEANKIGVKKEVLLASGDGNFAEKQVTSFTIQGYDEPSASQKSRISDRLGQSQGSSNARNGSVRGRFGGR